MANPSASLIVRHHTPDVQALSPQLDLTVVHAYCKDRHQRRISTGTGILGEDEDKNEDENIVEKVFSPSLLLTLPNEILSLILEFLDTPPPSHSKSHQRPDNRLTISRVHPLKTTSQTCLRLRLHTLPLLFRHAQVNPNYLTSFLAFLSTSNLISHVTTLTAILQGPCSHFHPAWWARVLNTIPRLQTLTVVAAPHVFAELAHLRIDESHSWAFNMPQHILMLSTTRPQLHSRLESQASSPAPSPSPSQTKQRISYNDIANLTLLTARPWTTVKYNEGSSLTAYATYEYYLKKTPCLISSLPHSSTPIGTATTTTTTNNSSSGSNVKINNSIDDTTAFLRNLRSFSFTAIFPFYNHVDDILRHVRQMSQLQHLFIKLCPEPESTVLEDEIKATKGHIDVNDPWNEFETSYSLITHTVNYLTLQGQLCEFQVDDVKMIGIRDSLEDKITRHLLLDRWWYRGNGVWCCQSCSEARQEIRQE